MVRDEPALRQQMRQQFSKVDPLAFQLLPTDAIPNTRPIRCGSAEPLLHKTTNQRAREPSEAP
eukprot:CAMPEP_0181196684 /NCGR_PEP_ID=MMETSP1096-20121128/15598_1 /TAXON_ID=156174 ORGANISM="Chrysochromulina ericina, Strain CCMP281" /NCGR_SAMPLE_ID=MMETSP1096 /ASSEMBLY_ACC=CAM_ASM_000453 /LENGTH=62 /DNA_ID=CAMNT_0023286463 /DNA_START=780 /DNA_END=968 /DNA_ORIENTATION=-